MYRISDSSHTQSAAFIVRGYVEFALGITFPMTLTMTRPYFFCLCFNYNYSYCFKTTQKRNGRNKKISIARETTLYTTKINFNYIIHSNLPRVETKTFVLGISSKRLIVIFVGFCPCQSHRKYLSISRVNSSAHVHLGYFEFLIVTPKNDMQIEVSRWIQCRLPRISNK